MRFTAIEGSNPLGFLAALGAFRLSDLSWPERNIRLRWVLDGGWRPELLGFPDADPVCFCSALAKDAPWAPIDNFAELGNNITVCLNLFRSVVDKVTGSISPKDRRSADFVASFGSDVFEDRKNNRIEYTDLCFITGSGHQHFLGTIRALAQNVTSDHLHEALFVGWRYADKGLSMRWDPDDAKEYALRWQDPSVGGVFTVWGANRLAFEALPLFPTLPTERGLQTTGFQTRNRAHEFTWPIWTGAVSLDTVRSMLNMRALQADEPDRALLQAMGIPEVFRAQRVRIGQGANFKVSFRPARSV